MKLLFDAARGMTHMECLWNFDKTYRQVPLPVFMEGRN